MNLIRETNPSVLKAMNWELFIENDPPTPVYHIAIKGLIVGKIAFDKHGDGIQIEEIEIYDSYRERGFGKAVVNHLLDKHDIIYGISIDEAKGFWKSIGVSFVDNNVFELRR